MAVATQPKTGFRLQWWHFLLIAVPAAGVVWFLDRSGPNAGQMTVWVFAVAAVALIPLASWIGDATDRLSSYVGDVAAGLLNATFSNVPELAIGIFLLVHALNNPGSRASDHEVILGLIIGSVINNVLLVLGASVFVASLRHGRMQFDSTNTASYSSMLALAVVGLALPTIANSVASEEVKSSGGLENVSLLVGVILVVSYIAYVGSTVFHWRDNPTSKAERLAAKQERAAQPKVDRDMRGFWLALLGLAFVTLLTVAIAGIMVNETDHVITGTFLTPLSVGLIIFPVLCNIGELAGVIGAAFRRDMELAMSIAGSSAVQVPLLVAPVLVFVAFALSGGAPDLMLPLVFLPIELIVVGLVTFVFSLVTLDGETTWLEGLQLVAFYAMVAATAFALGGR